jgi:hypothetical protein
MVRRYSLNKLLSNFEKNQFKKKDVERIIHAEIDGQLVFSNSGAVSRRETGLLNPPDLAVAWLFLFCHASAIQF